MGGGLVGRWVSKLVGWLVDYLMGYGRFVGWWVDVLGGRLVGWWVGSLVDG